MAQGPINVRNGKGRRWGFRIAADFGTVDENVNFLLLLYPLFKGSLFIMSEVKQ